MSSAGGKPFFQRQEKFLFLLDGQTRQGKTTLTAGQFVLCPALIKPLDCPPEQKSVCFREVPIVESWLAVSGGSTVINNYSPKWR